MKTLVLNLVKKNRVYFKCLTENGYEVKLKITQKSEHLELGKQELLVNDCSVRTKYGTDVIFELESVTKKDSIITLKHDRYNTILVEKCKNLGGKWDADEKVWVFNAIVEDKVEELELLFNSNVAQIEVTANEDLFGSQEAVYCCGYPIAKARGRDSGANLCDGVAMISGRINSGGSMKNWCTFVDKDSKFRLSCSKVLLDRCLFDSEWSFTILNEEI